MDRWRKRIDEERRKRRGAKLWGTSMVEKRRSVDISHLQPPGIAQRPHVVEKLPNKVENEVCANSLFE